MGMPLQTLSMTEYLVWESEQPDRHEYFRGETFAMVGARRGHGRVVSNLGRHIGNHFEEGPCQVFSENMKVRIADEAVLYPDIFVTCGAYFSADQQVFTDPVLIIEVLSPSTQRYDRSEKFAMYRKLPTLREYVLIDPATQRAEVFRLQNDGSCLYIDMTERGILTLSSIDFELALDQVFKGMDSSPPPAQ
jgi:Uma2 family endonuclease